MKRKLKTGKQQQQTVVTSMPPQQQEQIDSTTAKNETGIEKRKWGNRERVMVFCSRGASFRERHLMQDFRTLLPHSKCESKMDKNLSMQVINEISQMRNCSKCLYFECRKKKDVYLWVANTSKGPTAKFLLHNIHTMGELKMSGNCLKGSRPILSFGSDFETTPHHKVLKELFVQTLSTPSHHPRSQPFIDHVFNLSVAPDQKIWFRNYQIVEESEKKLEEIGPRMVLELVSVFEGSFGGAVLYQNPNYVNPNDYRREAKRAASHKYIQRMEAQKSLKIRKAENPPVETDPLDAVFQADSRKRPAGLGTSDESSGDEDATRKEADRLSKQIYKKRPRRKKAKKSPLP